jgi:Fe-Mn family superoxide dismutase
LRAFTSGQQSATLPDLPYDYGALEPFISAEIMRLHHSKHHNTYVTNLNIGLEQLEQAQAKGDITKIISLQNGIKFNGGGHLNHSIFWQNLAPAGRGGGGAPSGDLLQKIDATFGSFEELKKKMSVAAVAVQGSGWGWLGFNKLTGTLQIAACANQDPLEATTGLIPLLGIDVWEHAYYLQYKNVRPDYVNSIWNVVNWTDVAARFEAARRN